MPDIVHYIALPRFSKLLRFGAVVLFALFLLIASFTTASEPKIDQLTQTLLEEKSDKAIETSLERKKILLQEIQADPNLFVQHATLAGKRDEIFDQARENVEEEKEITGKVHILHVDYKDGRKSEEIYSLESEGKHYFLHFTDHPPKVTADSEVKVKALVIGNQAALSSSDYQGPTTKAVSPLPLTTGDQKTIAILINFANDQNQPISQSDMNGVLFSNFDSVNYFYKDASFNQTSFSGDVTNWLTIPYRNDESCVPYYDENGKLIGVSVDFNKIQNEWSSSAEAKAQEAGFNLGQYVKKIYIFSETPNCPFSGFAEFPGSKVWVVSAHQFPVVYAHELGHTFGLPHANSLDCGSDSVRNYENCNGYDINNPPNPPPFRGNEYGDVYSIMGNPWVVGGKPYHFNVPHKAALGWIPEQNIQNVSVTGIYDINYEEAATDKFQGLRIGKPDTGEYYYIGYRQPVGFDSTIPTSVTRGASLYIWNDDPSIQTKLVDLTPEEKDPSNTSFSDYAAFYDPPNTVSLRQLKHNSSLVKMAVSFFTGNNNSPELKTDSLTTAKKGKPYKGVLEGQDIDITDIVKISISNLPDWLRVENCRNIPNSDYTKIKVKCDVVSDRTPNSKDKLVLDTFIYDNKGGGQGRSVKLTVK